MSFAPKPTDPGRRKLLKAGLVGTAVLATAGIAVSVTSFNRASQQPATEGFGFLRPDDIILLSALIPAALGSTLSADLATRTPILDTMLQRIDGMILRLGAPNQKQLLQLFDLLSFAPSRYLTAGLTSTWDKATPAEVDAFLQRWRDSRVGLFNAAYRMLCKVATVTYFALPASFKESGYPGPWAPMYNAVNS